MKKKGNVTARKAQLEKKQGKRNNYENASMKEKLIAFHLFNLSQYFSIFLHFQDEVEVDCKYVVKSSEFSFSADLLYKMSLL